MFNLKRIFTNYRFKKHNRKIFDVNSNIKNKGKILVEFNAFATTHIPMSYFSNILSKKYNSKIVAAYNYFLVVNDFKNSFFMKLKWSIGKLFQLNFFGIYSSFGTSDFILPQSDEYTKKRKNRFIFKIKKKIKKKEDILKIKINSVLVGDIIYDTYLKRYKKETIILNNEFYGYFDQFVELFYYWENFFEANNIKATVGHHSVYSYAIPLRISINRNIPTFVINCMDMCQLNEKNMLTNFQYLDYKKNFKSLNYKYRKEAIKFSKQKLLSRVSGKINLNEVDYISKSAFKDDSNRITKPTKSKKIKVLIATHDFFDAVHCYGDLILPDFYEWIRFIGKHSKNTNIEWFIKTHPDFDGKFKISQNYTSKIVNRLIKEFPHIKLIKNNTSHLEIIKKGINFVFTCFGSITMEYAFFNVIPINAAPNNPFKNYKFGIHPKNKSELKNIILNLNKYKNFKISKKDLYEFFYMSYYFNPRNFFIKDYNEMIKFVDGYDGQFTYKLYEYWIKKYNYNNHNKRLDILKKFINSKDYFFIKKKYL